MGKKSGLEPKRALNLFVVIKCFSLYKGRKRSKKTNNQRVSFASSKILLEYPDLLEVQLKSFQDFFQLDTTPENRRNEGLYQVFQDIFPI